MSSFVKRNQNMLSILRKKLIGIASKDCVPGTLQFNVSRTLTESDITIPSEAFLNSINMPIKVNVGLAIKRPLVEVREYPGWAVIGINLENNVNYALNESALAARFRAVHKGPGVNPEAFSRELNKQLGIYTGNDFVKAGNMTNLYPNTALFQKAKQLCIDVLDSKCNVMRKPKEFPFMTDSSFLPIMLFDTETSQGYCFKNLSEGMTYKAHHSSISFSEISKNDIMTAYTYMPWPLFLLYDGKSFNELV